MKYRLCDLCGVKLIRNEMLFEIKDARDPYIKYHSRHWTVCDDCFEELEERRKKVMEEVSKDPSDNCCQCNPDAMNSGMIEF